jgi:hypothetical protein
MSILEKFILAASIAAAQFTLLLPSCFCMLFSLTLFYFSFFILVLGYSA